MILNAALLLVGFALIIYGGERYLDQIKGKNESSRKLVHVLHGVCVAVLVFIIPIIWIVILESVFLGAMFVARYLFLHNKKQRWVYYLNKVYRVGRLSYGEFFFPLSVIIVAFLANSEWEFAAALLVLGVADAIAALVGTRYGAMNSYKVFGQKKSLAGSAAFWLVSVIIVGWFVLFSGADLHTAAWLSLLWLPLVLTVAENLGVYGSDNLIIPVIAVLGLNLL